MHRRVVFWANHKCPPCLVLLPQPSVTVKHFSALEGTLLRLSPLSGTFERLSPMRAKLKAQGDRESPYRRLFFSKAFSPQEKACPFSLVIPLPMATPTKPSSSLLQSYGFPRPSLHLAMASFWRSSLLQLSCSRSGFPPGRPVSGSSPLAKSVPQRVLPYFT